MMLMVRNVLTLLFLLLACSIQAQQEPVLMRINGKEILRSEFEYSYNKYKEQPGIGQTTPKGYVDYFVDGKLVVAAAEAAGLDTVRAFREELEDYRSGLIKSYLTDDTAAEHAARQWYDKMKSRHWAGQARVSHIFKYLPQNVSANTLHEVEARMNSIYEEFQNDRTGTTFNTYVKNFSDEKEPFWLSRLQMPVEFEEVVSGLPVGEVSRPFFTPQGLHIVKVLERKELPSFEEMKDEILRRQTRRHGMDKGTEAQVEALKKEYHYTPDNAGLNELISSGHTNRTLFSLDGKNYTGKDFARFAAAHPEGMRRQLADFIMKSVLDYENDRLEQKHPDFRYLMQEHRERLLSGRITDKEIVERALSDTLGVKAYFDKHRSDYHWEEQRYKGVVLHGDTKRSVKQARKFLKSLPEEEWKDAIRLTFNAGEHPRIQAELGVFAPGDNVYVDDLVFKKGDAIPPASFPFTAVLGEKVKGPDDYREAGDVLVADYRSYLEKQWIVRLRASGKVEINQEVLKTVNNH
ncbi:MAG: peptidyl-prolyl cis-trans isomerase [Bacteroides sp.]|nr:peptidyl-prolyl cis-trans isomerase [Bacteroides sp.]